MITYKYSAQTASGEKKTDVIEAVDQFDAVSRIKEHYPIVLSIEEVKKTKVDEVLAIQLTNPVTPKYLSLMCKQFAIILKAGIPVGQSIRMVASQTKNKHIKAELMKASEDVMRGNTLANSFRKNCPDFPETLIETVNSGEVSGTIDKAFEALSNLYDKTYKLKQKIRSAFAYPLFIIAIAIVVLIIVMAFVVPNLTKSFMTLGGELPLITRILIGMSQFFAKYWMVIFAVIAVGILIHFIYTHTGQGKLNWAKFMLKAPVVGNLNILHGTEQFSTTMSSMIKSGLMLDRALEVTAKVMDNYALKQEVASMVDKIRTGHTLSDSINASPYFPDILKTMVGVGEQTGELEVTLDTMTEYYSNEYDVASSKTLSVLEKVILILLALFAGFIVISIYLPMFTIYDLM
ncbi:MAG: type II secretion system F family protein [Saccharofermentans sp.]|nr:type II secretion system F family protein [Saccharofermentans sp.]